MNKPDAKNMVIGFVGAGVMGKSMAGHVLAAGYKLNLFTRTKSKAEALLDKGALWCESVAELAADSDVIFTIVGTPQDVESLYLGTEGIIVNMQAGAVLVDMTTSSPELARRIADAAKAEGGSALDAPVSGGDVGAKEACLSIMVGGALETFERIRPLFELMGANIVYQGEAGAGQYCKMCNQIAIAGNMIGVCEALAYAQKSGLDPATVLKSISAGAAGSWSLSHLAPRMIAGDFDPGFYIKHFIKDMRIASESSKAMDLETPGLNLAQSLYETLAEQGSGEQGTQALYKHYIHDQTV
jgi:3-hydroxyisobutyrate dehydrogenase